MDTQAPEQVAVGVEIGVAGGQELVAVEDRIRTGEIAQHLRRVTELAAARRQTHHGLAAW